MALGRDVLEAIIREHTYRPIGGDVLLIGRQTIALSRNEVFELLCEHGVVASLSDVKAIFEAQNSGVLSAESVDEITAAAFFRLLGASTIRTLEPREGGADIVHDLDVPIPEYFESSADFMVDGGTLTNAFSAAAVLRNYASLLRVGGRFVGINNLSNHFDPYSILSAVWYLDFFVANRFADCKAYVIVYVPDQPPNSFYVNIDCLLDPASEVRSFQSSYEMAALIFAEKGGDASRHQRPVHAQERSAVEWTLYRRNLQRIKDISRPHLVRSRGEISDIDIRGGHLFMQSDYVAVDPSVALARSRDAALAAEVIAPLAPAARRRQTLLPLPVIHVGFGHSGTTSLQVNLFSRRADLFYAGVPHEQLGGIFSMIKYQDNDTYNASEIAQLCDDLIFNKISPEQRLVISDETLVEQPVIYFTPAMMPVRTIAERLRDRFGQVTILFTLRNQFQYVISNYLVLKKNYADLANRPIEPFDEWFEGNLTQLNNLFLRNLDISHAIKIYQDVFGAEAVHVLPLELLPTRGVGAYLECLAQITGIRVSSEDAENYVPRNVSASHQIVLNQEQLKVIGERSAGGNAFVAAEFGLPLGEFGYPM
jgi:hypothetical protein